MTSREWVRKIWKEDFLLGAGSSFGQIYGFRAHISILVSILVIILVIIFVIILII